MSNIEPTVLAVASALMILLPHVQAIIQRASWSPKIKSRITVGLAVLAGIGGYIYQNGFDFDLATLHDPAKLIMWIIAIYSGASNLYARFLRYNGSTQWLEDHVNSDQQNVE